jgi:DNA adenine methylase
VSSTGAPGVSRSASQEPLGHPVAPPGPLTAQEGDSTRVRADSNDRRRRPISDRAAEGWPRPSAPAPTLGRVRPCQPVLLSPFRFPGGKSWLVPYTRAWLSRASPRVLVEPFAGGSGVSLAAVSEGMVERAVLIERDEGITAVWQAALSDDAHELADRVSSFELTEESVRAVLDSTPAGALELAFAVLLRNRVARGGILAPGAGLLRAGEDGRGLSSRWYPETLARRLLSVHALRDRLQVRHADALAVLPEYAQREDVAVYLDPPYERAGQRLYTHHRVDHARLFELAADLAHPLLSYDEHEHVRELALAHNLDARAVLMRTTHHARAQELLVGRDLGWVVGVRRRLSAPSKPTGSAASSRQAARRNVAAEPSAQPAMMRALMSTRPSPRPSAAVPVTAAPTLLPIAEAAQLLGVSRRTAERMTRRGELERVDRGDARAYVTRSSVLAARDARHDGARRVASAGDLAVLVESLESMVATLRADRVALIEALRERGDAHERLAGLQAKLDAECSRREDAEARLDALLGLRAVMLADEAA